MQELYKFGMVSPLALATLAVLALCAALLFNRYGVRTERLEALGFLVSRSIIKVLALALLPLLLMSLALIRPYYGSQDIEIDSSGYDYMFLVDVSRSMLAKDVPPSRIELGKRKIKDLLEEFVKKGATNRYGITLFAGSSYALCPITDDVAVVRQFVNAISPDMVTSLGSNLEAGITTALERFSKSKSKNGRILLISDGEDDQIALKRVLTLIRSSDIPFDVLGVGTVEGSPIELEDGLFIRDNKGLIVNSKLNDNSLREIAKAANGVYIRATLSDEDILQLVRAGTPLLATNSTGKRTIRSYSEFGSWLALAALISAILISTFHRGGFALRAVLLMMLVAQTAVAQTTAAQTTAAQTTVAQDLTARDAFGLYNAGDFEGAAKAFSQVLVEEPNNRSLQQGLASALFKTGKLPEAQKLFRELADSAPNGRAYFENTFNEGNTLLAMKQFQDAIDAYTKALDVKPDDMQALHNRAVARALLEESKKNPPTHTPTPTPTPSSQSSPTSSSPTQTPSAEPSSSPSPSAAASPSASPDPSAAPSPQPSPNPSNKSQTATPNSSPSPHDTPLKEAQDKQDMEQQPPSSASPSADKEQELPPLGEAQSWLESLPESPLMIRREKREPPEGGQLW